MLLVDAQGHDIISAKIASTVHDTFHAFMLSDLDRNGRTTPEMFERINLRLGESITARNELGVGARNENWRENATMLYGEIRPNGHFRFVDFGHPLPPRFLRGMQEARGYRQSSYKCNSRRSEWRSPKIIPTPGIDICPWRREHAGISGPSDLSEFELMSPGDILFLYTDGVYDGSDEQDGFQIQQVIREHQNEPAKAICAAVLEYAVNQDERLRQMGIGVAWTIRQYSSSSAPKKFQSNALSILVFGNASSPI